MRNCGFLIGFGVHDIAYKAYIYAYYLFSIMSVENKAYLRS